MYVITDNCIACGSCEGVCPMGAITFDDDVYHYTIDQEQCVQCGSCYGTCRMGGIDRH